MVGCQLTLCCNDILWENMLVCLLLPQLSIKTSKQMKKETFLCSGHAGVDAKVKSREGNRAGSSWWFCTLLRRSDSVAWQLLFHA